ncbi:MAG: hypothetical protein HQ497_15165 [SAR86 cluster bacterium]|uniref:ABC-type transport auxiliary lipoprotein component domain-containing protein n=1 Tax=SAR86 cluster bacterium TaxID=2030880 RepID=A0A972W1P2_9GAMM|nr:hypothetical protein [SAR86 cluster bacterium]
MTRAALLTLVLLLSACATQHRDISVTVHAPEALIVAGTPTLPYFNISIAVFSNPSLIPDNASAGRINRIYGPIHEAEANYLPIILRNSLIESGHWGAVRVGPSEDVAAELQITATILTSTALDLALHVKVVDSRGGIWIDNLSSDQAQTAAYAVDERLRQDPFH